MVPGAGIEPQHLCGFWGLVGILRAFALHEAAHFGFQPPRPALAQWGRKAWLLGVMVNDRLALQAEHGRKVIRGQNVHALLLYAFKRLSQVKHGKVAL